MTTAEHDRLAESPDPDDSWRLWGPYVSGRQWGTVREDYSANGDAWNYFPFDHAHQRTYRWGEDGIAGLCDRFGFLNLAVALWNGADDSLKERFFGLTNAEGNHGEDVKEYWWHLDGTPTHSYAHLRYRYPQAAFPYQQLREENARRTRDDDEFELADTGIFAENRYFDVDVVHAKAAPDDICIRITATNRGPDPAPLDVVPQLWFRNTWRWTADARVPSLTLPDLARQPAGETVVEAHHGYLGRYRWHLRGAPEVVFCDNETDDVAVFGSEAGASAYPKNGVDRAVVHGDRSALNPARTGTKAAARYHFDAVVPGQTVTVDMRLSGGTPSLSQFGPEFEAVLRDRKDDADEFFAEVLRGAPAEDAAIARRAFAGLQWCKQVYRFDVKTWLAGDPAEPPPPPERRSRDHTDVSWRHLYLADVMSMPDEWEYPWFATWDLAFHCVTIAHVDPAFAKQQLILLCREWSQHPDGQLPAYEWAFGDLNPPVHAWAAWTVYQLDGAWDRDFLVRVFGKLLLNFTWWVNRKDSDGSNLFEGGFLGMDNIGPFDRSQGVPAGWILEQSDATSWMAFFSLTMLRIALELSRQDNAWDDLATTFLERFVAIAHATESFGTENTELWDDVDQFYYDTLVQGDTAEPLRARSLVGLLPLLAVAVAPTWVVAELTDFTDRLRWLEVNDADKTANVIVRQTDRGERLTMSLADPERVEAVLTRMLDENEFLSPFGIRSLSAAYREGVEIQAAGTTFPLRYDPGESTSGMFGGNSNWRGPVWLPVNVLLIDALRTYATGVGEDMLVEYPTGSGSHVPLREVARDLAERLVSLFRRADDGTYPAMPRDQRGLSGLDDVLTFSEYFHGDDGHGLGGSHQTGWSALVAHLVATRARR